MQGDNVSTQPLVSSTPATTVTVKSTDTPALSPTSAAISVRSTEATGGGEEVSSYAEEFPTEAPVAQQQRDIANDTVGYRGLNFIQ